MHWRSVQRIGNAWPEVVARSVLERTVYMETMTVCRIDEPVGPHRIVISDEIEERVSEGPGGEVTRLRVRLGDCRVCRIRKAYPVAFDFLQMGSPLT